MDIRSLITWCWKEEAVRDLLWDDERGGGFIFSNRK